MKKIIYFVFLLIFINTLYAQVRYKSELPVNTVLDYNQRHPNINMNLDGSFIVVWQTYLHPDGGDDYDIAARRFDAAGNGLAAEQLINIARTSTQQFPVVTQDGLGRYWIAWMSNSVNPSLGYSVKLRQYDSDFNPITGEITVNTKDSLEQAYPAIASNDNGDVIVVWEGQETADSSYNIYGQLYDATGAPVDSNFIINTTISNDHRYPKVAMNDEGFVVTWQGGITFSNWNTFFQRYDLTANKLGGEVQVNTYTSAFQRPTSIAINDNGRFVIVWRSDSQDFSENGVYYKQYNNDGTERFAELRANQVTQGEQTYGAVDIDSLNNFVIAWESVNKDAEGFGIVARRFDEDGNALTDEFIVNTIEDNNQLSASIAVKNQGDFVVTWNSYDSTAISRDNIKMQMYKMGPKFSALSAITATEDTDKDILLADFYPYVADEDNLDTELTWEFFNGTNISTSFADGTLTISPDANFAGLDSFMVVATDPAGLTDTTYQAVNVAPVNDAPVVSDIANQTVAEGSTFAMINLNNLVADVDDLDSEILWVATGQSELVVTIDENNVATVAIPNINWFGSETITFTATDPGELTDNDVATFTVNAVNDAPVVTDIPGQTIAEGASFTTINLDGYVSDVDNTDAQMTWTATGQSDLTVSIVNRVATISAPDANWYGAETITFTATDPGNLTDSDGAVFTVTNVNDAPVVIDIPAQSINEGQTFAAINLDSYVNDIDNTDSQITWNYSGNTDLVVDINPVNRVAVVSIPNGNWTGNETITFTATDPGGLFDSDAATFTVNNVNDAPVVSDIPNQTIAEGATFTTITLDDYVADVDNADSEISWAAMGNTELNVTITNRVATISVPDANWNGNETITFTATDPGELSDSNAATFTVTAVNDAPVVTDIPNQTIAEGASFTTITLDDYVSDVDNTDAQMNWIYSGNSELTVSITNRVATISVPNANWNGNETITFTASDPGGLSDNDAAIFTVTAVNDAPVVSDIPNQSIAEGGTFTTITLDDYVSDVDNTDAQMNWTYSGNTDLVVSISAGRVATISTPNTNWNGNEAITFTATDPGDLSDSDAATFTVSAENDPPVVTGIPDQTIAEGATFATINLDDYVSDLDNTDAQMTWSYSGQTELTVSITNRVATIGIPNANWNGSETITFTATDPGSLSNSDAAVFTVTAVNDAPVVTDIPDQTIAEGASFTAISLDAYVSDVDNADNQINWSYSGNDQLIVAIDENRVATISVPNADWNGNETITFTATDAGELSDNDAAVFTVNAENDAPVVADIPNQTIAEGSTFATINLDDYVSDTDNTDAEISWSSSETTDLTVSIDENRIATITVPDENWNGNESITFTATDPGELSDNEDATFTVTAVNDAPVVTPIPDQTVDEGVSFASINLDNYVNDIDNGDSEMSWSFSGNNQLQVAIDTNRVASITAPSVDWNGSETVIFSVSDPGELSVTDTVAFTVTAVNDAPVVAGVPAVNFKEDNSLLLTKSSWYQYVSDPDNADSVLVFSISGGKNVATQYANGSFTFSAPQNWFGSDTLELKISDGELSDSTSFQVTVHAVNDAPQLVELPQSLSMDDTSSYILNVNDFVQDVDSPVASLVWSFSADNDSLLLDFDEASAQLTISALAFGGDVQVVVTVTDDSSASSSDTIIVQISLVTALDELVNIIPVEYSISQNYPNPFNPTTQIKYGLPKASKVKVEVYNIIGQKVATLVNSSMPAGYHIVNFDASKLASGMYFYRIQAAKFNKVRKMILMK